MKMNEKNLIVSVTLLTRVRRMRNYTKASIQIIRVRKEEIPKNQ